MRPNSNARPNVRLPAHCDPSVIDEMYDTYGAVCYALAYKILAHPGEAANVVRAAFLQVWAERGGVAAFDSRRVGARLVAISYHASNSIAAVRGSRSTIPSLRTSNVTVLSQQEAAERRTQLNAADAGHAAEQLVALESLSRALRDRQASWQAQGVEMQRNNPDAPEGIKVLSASDPGIAED